MKKLLKFSLRRSCARCGEAWGEEMLERKAKRKADWRLNSRDIRRRAATQEGPLLRRAATQAEQQLFCAKSRRSTAWSS
eukprot:5643783-Prymnesium_polylepis.1